MTQKFEKDSIIMTPKGLIKVLEYFPGKRLEGNRKQHPRATIRFIESGWVCNVQTTNIMSGHVEDCRAKTVYGVGYLDTDLRIPSRASGSIIRKIYDLWANMLKRCYGAYFTSYEGCSVDKRWHSFKNFLNTIPSVPGYAEWEAGKNYHLDKDIKVKGNTCYSLITCLFVPASDNVIDSLTRRWARD